MNRRTFIKRMGQFFGLPVAAAVLPLPKVPVDVYGRGPLESTLLDAAKIRKVKTLLDAQPVPDFDRMLWINDEAFADSIVESWQNDA